MQVSYRTFRTAAAAFLLVALTGLSLTSRVLAEAPEHAPSMATDGDGAHLFSASPADQGTAGNRAGVLFNRNFKSSEIKLAQGDAETRTADLKNDLIAVSGLADLGAGTAAGITAARDWIEMNSQSTNGSVRPRELFQTQTVTGRILIDLTPQVRAGLSIRQQSQESLVVGGFNNQESIVYRGSLVGYGAGAAARLGPKFGVGAQWVPAMRGKATIIGEQRLLAEPGRAGVSAWHGDDAQRFGVMWQRWVHKRDDRADNTSTGGENNRQVILEGMDFDNFLYPVWALGVGLDHRIRPNLGLRAHAGRETAEFIFNTDQVPGENPDGQRLDYWRLRGAVKLINPGFALELGLGFWQRSLSLSAGSGPRGEYKASGRELWLVFGGAI